MKVTTDACLFGAWVAGEINNEELIINNLLDVGTGTGLLSLMIVQKTGFSIDAIEIENGSFEQGKENIESSPWNDRINIFYEDAKKFRPSHHYDVIISNPPFYENELKSEDEKRNIALHGNELTFEDLLKTIDSNLSSDGTFFILLPYKRQDEIRKIFQKYQFSLSKMIFVRQSIKHDYFRMMIMGKKKSTEPIETAFDEISIWDEKQQYTKQFTELLKDYYLYL